MSSSPEGENGADERRAPVQRKKITIRPIPEARKRQVTFMKRKKGLLKKAKELSILCNCDMAVLIFDKHNQCFQFASGDIAETLARFEQAVEDPSTQREHKTNADYRAIAKLGDGEGDGEDAEDSDAEPSRANSGRKLQLPNSTDQSKDVTLATTVTGISPVFDSPETAAAPKTHAQQVPRRGEKRRLSDEGRPGKLPPGVHAYMVSRLQAWTEHHPGESIPNRMEKEALSRECGVAVRSIEYWFWARNKKLRADPDAFSPGGSRHAKVKSPPNPESHWSSWDPKRPHEEDDAIKKAPSKKAASVQDDWMSEPVQYHERPAAAPVAAGADSLLSSGSAPQQLQDLLGNGASRFPNVEIPPDSCAEEGQDHAEESPLQISSAGSSTAGATSWTDGPDSMEPGCWGWNQEHGDGSDNADGKTDKQQHACTPLRARTHT